MSENEINSKAVNDKVEEDDNCLPGILDLPDHFIISVFRLFNLKERLKFSSVCHKWNLINRDGSLWTKIDLRQYKLNINIEDLRSIINIYGSMCSKELLLTGIYCLEDYLDSSTIGTNKRLMMYSNENNKKKRLFYLDSNFLNDTLSVKCPNLVKISLEYFDLTELDFYQLSFFKNLSELSLKWCNIKENWFQIDQSKKDAIKNLKSLYLNRTGSLNKQDIENICLQMPNLSLLSINQSQSTISDDSIEVIIKHLKELRELELINTSISDNAIFSICQSNDLSKRLVRLNFSMSSSLSNNIITAIGESLINLRSLYLTSCFGISNVNLFHNLINLNYLNLNNTSIDKNAIKNILLPMLPHCEIEYGHEKMLNRKLMWTINGSRNCVCSF